ncbi:Catabolite repression protein creC [Smittium mucronatum]|uniref:Catabolite repression protein creC n=1 Tax=Smittium mucronatum TaxID=133383 RepID=A0A1R0GQ80_9FUNG|nr:Catabolite repression protein creC [Smittium mucronatum]
MSDEDNVTEIQTPEGAWSLSMGVTASVITNQILPKIDPVLIYESVNKPPTSIVNGEMESSITYKGTDKPSYKTTKTALVGGMLIFDSHLQNNGNFRDNMINMTEKGRVINNPTHFSIIPAPYKAPAFRKPEIDEKRIFGLLNKSKKDKASHDSALIKESKTDLNLKSNSPPILEPVTTDHDSRRHTLGVLPNEAQIDFSKNVLTDDAPPVKDFSFSPDFIHMSAVGKDGYMRTIDYRKKIYDSFLTKIGFWTFILHILDLSAVFVGATGGKDDMVSVWSFIDRKLVARCFGHDSWVTGVAFDNNLSEDPNEYRFASVGEDTKLILWDFSLASLSRPKSFFSKTPNLASSGHGRNHSLAMSGHGRNPSLALSVDNSHDPKPGDKPVVHPRSGRGEVSVLQPISVKSL